MNEANSLRIRFLNVLAVFLRALTVASFVFVALALVIVSYGNIKAIESVDSSNWYYIFPAILLHPGMILALPTLLIVLITNYLVFGEFGLWAKLQRATRQPRA